MATMSASRRVLSLTELVSLIFEFVAVGYLPGDDEGFYMLENPRRIASSTSRATLWNCAQVNTLWFREAMRHLWSELSGSKFGALESMPLARRQIYMSFVTRLSLVCAPYSSQRNGLLKGLNFPRVRSVTIQFWEKLKLLYLPKIQSPALRVLDIRLAMIMPTDTHILFDDRVEKRFVERCKVAFAVPFQVH